MSQTFPSQPATAAATDARHPVLVTTLARFLLRIFFRRIEVAGREHLPEDGPVVFVANHVNALVDPALLLAFLPRKPRFLAKSTLWAIPIVRPLLELAAAIPVYRRQDAGVDPAQNAETFARCHAALAAGGSIALFPEGRSHNEPALVPLKTGVSRIVLEAESQYGGRLGIRIVPVGLTFEEKSRFRSRVLLQIGEPISAATELALYATDPQAAVQALTARVRTALAATTLNYPSWEEARWIERAAEIWQRPSAELPAQLSLEERFPVRQAFITGYEVLRQRFPQRVHEVAEAVERYDDLLELCGLRDEQVAASYPPRRVLRFVGKSGWLLVGRLPLAAIGTLLHAGPYFLARRVAERRPTADEVATYKLFTSLVFYPLTWLVAGLAVGWRWGAWAGVAVVLLAPLAGYAALRFHERRRYFRREARAYLLLQSGRRQIEELRRQRAEVLRAVEELAAVYRTLDPARAEA